MNDKELLTLAAKAANIYGDYWRGGVFYVGYLKMGILQCVEGEEETAFTWNPLTDDGDAFRLAVKLCLSLDVAGRTTSCFRHDIDGFTETSSDPYAATRRAIVRAAAEIGERAQG